MSPFISLHLHFPLCKVSVSLLCSTYCYRYVLNTYTENKPVMLHMTHTIYGVYTHTKWVHYPLAVDQMFVYPLRILC